MAVIPIVQGKDNEILRVKSKEIKKINKKEFKKLFEEMRETMFKANGIGLAAPQIGLNIRVCVCLFNSGTPNEIIVDMINPKIIRFSDEKQIEEEGCLSLPNKFGKVERHESITVKFQDLKGNDQVLTLKGLDSTIVQHEIDHLDGILFIDRVKNSVPAMEQIKQ
ncbi:peptide deformylase [Candidatus Peregrinibacteria bacterium]|nr:peptide deformylase [Candidatus Peregrinibacteria bacterium]